MALWFDSNHTFLDRPSLIISVALWSFALDFLYFFAFFFLSDFKFIFRERGREREREGEKYQCVVASRSPHTGDLACNPGRESNLRPFGLQAGTHSTEPHQPGLPFVFFMAPGTSGPCVTW